MIETLNIIDKAFTELGFKYAFMRWDSEVTYPYMVGFYDEIETNSEDGQSEYEFTVEIFHRGSFLDLEEIKEKIKKYFTKEGRIWNIKNNAVVISYERALLIEQDDSELKRMNIYLMIKKWEVE